MWLIVCSTSAHIRILLTQHICMVAILERSLEVQHRYMANYLLCKLRKKCDVTVQFQLLG